MGKRRFGKHLIPDTDSPILLLLQDVAARCSAPQVVRQRKICGFHAIGEGDNFPFNVDLVNAAAGLGEVRVRPDVDLSSLKESEFVFHIEAYDCDNPPHFSQRSTFAFPGLVAPNTSGVVVYHTRFRPTRLKAVYVCEADYSVSLSQSLIIQVTHFGKACRPELTVVGHRGESAYV
ncbi:unnamed protein product [Dibothriocephalus latus]|uniref:Uncharacterized protein n=1 Tax=Dibothriocephalus latus TaxID=60516 RepID=A0A3P6U040_DIBLA|nr:unnamed protein product [Dibothriocephalus latus]